MLRNKYLLKAISFFLLANVLLSLFLPAAAVASTYQVKNIQTKTIDLPDYVDLKTGDFNYDLPLMEVPGPDGGYQVELDYKAGIQSDQEASWVGLGWNLGAGSISRTVNGYPDDYNRGGVTIYSTWGLTDEAYEVWTPLASNQSTPTYQSGWSHSSTACYGLLSAYDAANTNTSGVPSTRFKSLDYSLLSDLSIHDSMYYSLFSGDPIRMRGGVMPSYDSYFLSGPGIAGQIEPVVLENGSLFTECASSQYLDYDVLKKYQKTKQQFRFKNDCSNSFKVNPEMIAHQGDSYFLNNNLAYTYTGPTETTIDTASFRLASSKHINYFTNNEIYNQTAKSQGFINYPGTVERQTFALASSTDISNQVGGFSVTKEDGMTYHYALPAYQYNLHEWYDADFKTEGRTHKEVMPLAPYAYTWLLTTITGNDFVDKNGNGIADEEDAGYWTNFNYGLWTGDYFTSYPYTNTGIMKAMDDSYYSNTSSKEIYYLDAVYTKSHTALFLKTARNDGYGIYNSSNGNPAKGLLGLKSVNLYSNEDILTMSATSTNSFSKSIFTSIQELKKISTQKYSLSAYAGVIDFNDAYVGTTLVSHFPTHNPLKRVEMVYDYSLANYNPSNTSGGGKLTLNSVKFFGRSEVRDKPSVDFQYELPSPKTFPVQITHIPSDFGTQRNGRVDMGNNPNPFQEGDIIKFTVSGVTYHATLVRGIVYGPYGTHISLYEVHYLGPNIPDASKKSILTTAIQTKNPPYSKNCRDSWGYFKSNYNDSLYNPTLLPSGIENFDRRTDRISAQSVDVWSLRRIINSNGATIDMEYESDIHSNPTDNYNRGKTNPRGVLNVKSVGRSLNGTSGIFYSDKFEVNALNRAGSYEFKFKEYINYIEEFYVGQVITIQTQATFTQNGGAFDKKWPNTFTGSDLFKITYVENSPNQLIRGVFIPNQSNDGFENPLAATKYVSPLHDLWLAHNGSYVMYEPKQKYGGGVRTKKVTFRENDSNNYFSNQYSYTNKANGYSSGMTATEPLTFGGVDTLNRALGTDYTDIYTYGSPYYHNYDYGNNYKKCRQKYFTKNLFTGFYQTLSNNYINEQVVYEYVTQKQIGNGDQSVLYKEYKHQVFSDDMVVKTTLSDYPDIPNNYSVARTTKVVDKSSCIGNLLQVKVMDQQNDLINDTKYNYSYTDQGIVEQVFHEVRYLFAKPPYVPYLDVSVATVLSKQPNVLTSVTIKDHVKGGANTITYKTLDFNTGEPIVAESKDSYGNTTVNVNHKAYQTYTTLPSTGAEMGLKTMNNNNRHMLSQVAAHYTYQPNNTGNLPFTITGLTSTTGAKYRRFKATLDNNKTLPFNYVVNGSYPMTTGSTSGNEIITYIYPDRKSFEFNKTIDYNLYSGSLNNVNVNTPLSATIQPWSNNWQYRNYNTTTNLFENITVTESSPATPNAYKKMWRPAAPYVWNSPFLNTDGSYKSTGTGAYVEFDWAAELAGSAQSGMTASAYWQKGIQPTLKDEFSNTLEVKDVNGNYSATKMANDQSYILKNSGGYTFTYPNTANYKRYVLTSGKNTNYASFAFSSFEEISKPSGADQYGGEIAGNISGSQYSSTTTPLIKPHTGNYCLKLYPYVGGYPFTATYNAANTEGNILRGKKYRASIWVHKNSNADASMTYSIVGSSGVVISTASVTKSNALITVGDWSLMTIDFDVPANYTSVSSSDGVKVTLSAGTGSNSYFDDFAVRPIDADQTSYVYDPLTMQVLYVIDKDGFYTRYQYDNTGRLIATYKETLAGEKKIATQEYNFAKP